MDLSKVAPVEHLVVNRAKVTGEGCRACGEIFAAGADGVRALSVAVGPDGATCLFCANCAEMIMGHVHSEAARQHYEWDWLIPLHRTPSVDDELSPQSAAVALPGDGQGFHAFGKTYPSERAAILALLAKVRASEANAAEAFAAWSAVCRTEALKSGILMIAEREAGHARIFERRLIELGAELQPVQPEEGRRFKDYLGDPNIADREKLRRFTWSLGKPEESIQPIRNFAALITQDIQTRDALMLLAEDEFASATWAWKSCAALNVLPHPTQTSH